MIHRLLFVLLVGCTWACGSSEFTAQDGTGGKTSNGAGGKSASGGRSSRGGNGSATTPAAQCNTLQKEYLAALEAARLCDPAQGEAACKADWVLPGTCQCGVPVVRETPAYNTAQTKLQAFQNLGCEMALCEMACPGDASGETEPSCVAGADGAAVCQWP